jgi:hypothetical protein
LRGGGGSAITRRSVSYVEGGESMLRGNPCPIGPR